MLHTWILECLKLYKDNETASSTSHHQVWDLPSLSPLLFCISLNPLSEIIKKTDYGYQIQNGANIIHLLKS